MLVQFSHRGKQEFRLYEVERSTDMEERREEPAKEKSWFILPAYVGSLPDNDDVFACPECKSAKFVAAMVDEEDGTSTCVCCEGGHASRPDELVRIPVIEATGAEEFSGRAAGHALDVWMNQFWTETKGSSDRAFAILSGAMLDEVLEIMLSALAIDDELLKKRLLNPNQPLGSFGPKIDACYLFGLISEREWKALRLVQKIRNAFAHKLANLSFEDSSMANRARAIINVLQLRGPQEDDARKVFQVGVSALWTSLMGKITLVTRAPKMPFDPSGAMIMHYNIAGRYHRGES